MSVQRCLHSQSSPTNRVWRSTCHTLHKSTWEANQKRLRDPQGRPLCPSKQGWGHHLPLDQRCNNQLRSPPGHPWIRQLLQADQHRHLCHTQQACTLQSNNYECDSHPQAQMQGRRLGPCAHCMVHPQRLLKRCCWQSTQCPSQTILLPAQALPHGLLYHHTISKPWTPKRLVVPPQHPHQKELRKAYYSK
jgi:hypothetical protein